MGDCLPIRRQACREAVLAPPVILVVVVKNLDVVVMLLDAVVLAGRMGRMRGATAAVGVTCGTIRSLSTSVDGGGRAGSWAAVS